MAGLGQAAITDPALSAILQRRRLLSEPEAIWSDQNSFAKNGAGTRNKASDGFVRQGLVHSALAAIHERQRVSSEQSRTHESRLQCFDMASDSEDEPPEAFGQAAAPIPDDDAPCPVNFFDMATDSEDEPQEEVTHVPDAEAPCPSQCLDTAIALQDKDLESGQKVVCIPSGDEATSGVTRPKSSCADKATQCCSVDEGQFAATHYDGGSWGQWLEANKGGKLSELFSGISMDVSSAELQALLCSQLKIRDVDALCLLAKHHNSFQSMTHARTLRQTFQGHGLQTLRVTGCALILEAETAEDDTRILNDDEQKMRQLEQDNLELRRTVQQLEARLAEAGHQLPGAEVHQPAILLQNRADVSLAEKPNSASHAEQIGACLARAEVQSTDGEYSGVCSDDMTPSLVDSRPCVETDALLLAEHVMASAVESVESLPSAEADSLLPGLPLPVERSGDSSAAVPARVEVEACIDSGAVHAERPLDEETKERPVEHSGDSIATAPAQVEVEACIEVGAAAPLLVESKPSAHAECPLDDEAKTRPVEHSGDSSATALAGVKVVACIDSSAEVPLLVESKTGANAERPLEEEASTRSAETQALVPESPNIKGTCLDDAQDNHSTEADQEVAQRSTPQLNSHEPSAEADQKVAQTSTAQLNSQQAQPEESQPGKDVDMQAVLSACAGIGQQPESTPICVELLSIQNKNEEAIKINMTSRSKVKDLRVAVKEIMGLDDKALRQLRLLKKKGNCYLTLSDDEPVRQKVYLHHPDINSGKVSPQALAQPSDAQQRGWQETRHVKNLKHELPLGIDKPVLDFTQMMFEKMTHEEREAWNDLPRHVIWIMWFDMLGSPLFMKCADQQFRESVFGANFEKKASINLAKSDPVLKEYAFHKRKLISVWFSETGADVMQEKERNANLLFDFDELDDLIA